MSHKVEETMIIVIPKNTYGSITVEDLALIDEYCTQDAMISIKKHLELLNGPSDLSPDIPNPHNLHYKFVTILKENGFKLNRTTGDGNCLFRAVSFLVSQDESNHLHYRDQLCNFLTENQSEFIQYYAVDVVRENLVENEPLENSYTKFVIDLRRNGTYADAFCVSRMGLMLEKNVHVIYFENREIVDAPVCDIFTDTLYFFYDFNHYSSLTKINK